MKKVARILMMVALVVGLAGVCGTTTSCKSSDTMYTSKNKKAKKINRNYKVRGDNKKNSSTYHTY